MITPTEYKLIAPVKIDKVLGYKYFLDMKHPLVNSQGKVYHHRHIASIKIGRWLSSEEVVHHIDENRANNDEHNLQVLGSHSCHAKLHVIERGDVLRQIKECPVCQISFIGTKDIICCSRSCARSMRNSPLKDICKEDLEELIWQIPTTKIAEKYNVSDTAISKKCKKWKINKPPRGYWEKIYHSQ